MSIYRYATHGRHGGYRKDRGGHKGTFKPLFSKAEMLKDVLFLPASCAQINCPPTKRQRNKDRPLMENIDKDRMKKSC